MRKNLQTLSFIAGASALAVLAMAGIMASPSLSLLEGAGTTSDCATVAFSSTDTSLNGAVSSDTGYTASGVSVSSVSYVKALSTAGTGLRIGSSSANGSVTVAFSSSASLWQVSIDGAVYGSDSPTLTLSSSSASLSNGGTALSGSESTNYDLYYSFAAPISVDSITIAGSARFYIYDIRLGLFGGSTSSASSGQSAASFSSTSASSSVSASSTASTFDSSSSISSSSSSTSEASAAYRRIAPVEASGNTLTVYSIDGTVDRTLGKSSVSDSSTWYTDYEDVALYYQGFGSLPANYCYGTDSSAKSSAYATYGTKARLYTEYYTRTDGYMTAFPTPNAYSYFEADIGGTSAYAAGPSWNRGTYRLVVIPGGLQQYGADPVLFYTTDHYSSFQECYNYAGGWSGVFDGESTGYGTYATPTTVTLPSA